MRKPYSNETRNDIVEKYLLGESVRDIHDSTGVSMGSISEYIGDFSTKIEKQTIDAMHDFFKIIRKNGLQPKDAFYGHVVFSILAKHNLDPKQINLFVESVLSTAKQNELSAEELIKLCKMISAIQSNSDVPLDEIENYYTELVKNKTSLEESITTLSTQHKQSQDDLSNMLKKKDLTEKQIEKIEHALKFLEDIGFDLSDVHSVYNMLQNAKNKDYDIAEILSYLSRDKSIESALAEKQSKLDAVENSVQKLEKKYSNVSLRHENLTLRHDSMMKSIVSLGHLGKSGVSSNDITAWQQIFDQFGVSTTDFVIQLGKIGNAKKLSRKLDTKNVKLSKEIKSLEKKKMWLENKSSELSAEISNGVEFGKKNLKKITDHAESQFNSTVINTKKSIDDFMKQNQSQLNVSQKQFQDYFLELTLKLEELLEHSHKAEHTLAKMESLKPLYDLINGKFDPPLSIPQVVTVLDKLYVGLKNTNLDKRMLSSDVKRIREHLLDLISHA